MEFRTNIEKSDIQEIVSSIYINWEHYKNATILVTGATGLIGSVVVNSILYANETLNTNIKILALARNIEKTEYLFGENKTEKLEYLFQNILAPIKYDGEVDFIIHTANSTNSKSFVEQPVETIDTILSGTKNVLNFAKEKQIKGMVYLSSMEVYGKTDFARQEPLKEKDYGYIDILAERSSYPEAKRMAEMMCYSYAKEYNLPAKIARLVQTIGANVEYNDNRVFVQFARNVIEKTNIVLKTDGKSERSYCYLTDAITAIFTILEKGCVGEAYNVANEDTNCSILQMAKLLCSKYRYISIKFNLNNEIYPPNSKLFVNTSKLKNLKWQATVGLDEMYNRLIENLKRKSN